ncbi:MAG: protein kinase [bacterium]|nr:protein kinase [bacterium]
MHSSRRWIAPFVLGIATVFTVNAPRAIEELLGFNLESWPWVHKLAHPSVSLVGSSIAVVFLLWGVIRLFGQSSPPLRIARTLQRRGDLQGAAEMFLKAGRERRALDLFRKARAWPEAARVARKLGDDVGAANDLRRAGDRNMAEAAALFRRSGDKLSARKCEHEFAAWLMQSGRFDESIEAWMRAGEVTRAARTALVAVNEGRLQPTVPAFAAAHRAAEQTSHHTLTARLFELESGWSRAAHAWRSAGNHPKAAENFRRAGDFAAAAQSEADSGRPRESVQLRVQRVRSLRKKLGTNDSLPGVSKEELERISVELTQETKDLLPKLRELGMSSEIVEILEHSGRIEEAVDELISQGYTTAAADLAHNHRRWDLAAGLLETLNRWAEASDVYELADDLEAAARCAEKAGEDSRALELYRRSGSARSAAHCLARLGRLQDSLVELHAIGDLREACSVLRNFPGPVPDIAEVILDLANWAKSEASTAEAIACLQRAVLGVALQPSRLAPAVELARFLNEVGDEEAALAQLERILDFDYAHEPARELKRKIKRHQQLQGLVSTRAISDEVEGSVVSTSRVEDRYEILDELGRGGMGVVYRARDSRLERDVAIKVLRTTSRKEAARLEREAKAVATLNHPGIVTVFDFETGFGGHFIAMEYVPGEPLDRVLRRDPGRISSELRGLLLRLAEAVAYAHDHHVIHRDLKPGNVLLTQGGEVKILDFGIAARLDTDSGSSAAVCGTPFYMAPEQIRGEVPTPATDIYAFGATAFHLATGRPPFSRGNVIEAHLKMQPPRPDELVPSLDPELTEIILRCLEKEPGSRFTHGGELRDSLMLRQE